MRVRALRIAIATALLGLSCPSCATLVEYTDGLRKDPKYTFVVRGAAQVGGAIGFMAGIPVDVIALPVTYPLYLYQDSTEQEDTDFTSTVLFPSFALLEVCSLLGAPFDLLEFAVYRAWRPDRARTAEEQEEFEFEVDDDTLPAYPVVPIYPKERS